MCCRLKNVSLIPSRAERFGSAKSRVLLLNLLDLVELYICASLFVCFRVRQ